MEAVSRPGCHAVFFFTPTHVRVSFWTFLVQDDDDFPKTQFSRTS